MPSPFPGMDPYLEDQEHWMNVHASLITEIGSRLTEQLRPRYFGRIAQRAYLTKDDDPAWKTIILDAYLVVTPPMSGGRRGSSPSASRSDLNDPSLENESGGVAVAAEPVTIRFPAFEMREPYLEIIDTRDRKVITIIEVLSPTNKVAGSRGRRKYKRKRDRVLQSRTHLVEIDLLRGGASFFSEEMRAGCDYTVHVSREIDRPDESQLWRITLAQILPSILISLCDDDPDATLDLNAAWHAIYDKAAFDLVLDYKQEPGTPLTPAQAAWSDRLLRTKGLR